MTRRAIGYNMWFELGPKRIFLTKLWTFEKSPVCMVTVVKARIAMIKLSFAQKTDPSNKFLNIVFSSSSSTHRHTSTRSCYNIYTSSRLLGLSVPTFRIFEDFRGFWLGTSNIYPGCPTKNIWDFTMKIFFFQKNQKSVTVVLPRIEFCVVPPWQNFRKLSQFSINGRIWLTFRV